MSLRRLTHILGVWIWLFSVGSAVSVGAVEDRAIGVSGEDEEMNAAIEAARAKLPHFWRVMAAPRNKEADFCLKVRITQGERVEHFWCTDVAMKGGKITAVIGNDPQMVTSVRLGQSITVKEEDISDWLYLKDGKMIGNYTVRPLMKSMTTEERDYLKANLGELPAD